MNQNVVTTAYKQALNKTFANAFNGIQQFFKTERNGKIQAAVALFIILIGFYFRLSSVEWILTLVCIGSVIGLEMLNSAIEHLCNLVHNNYHPAIKIIKDMAAGAVLFAAVISVIIGLIIFIPKVLFLLL